MDIIEIKNLRLHTLIGFSAHELDVEQDVVINLNVGYNNRLAGETDDPREAFNYKTLNKAIIRLVTNARVKLIEKLAEDIAKLAIVDFNAPYVQVQIHKPGALRNADSVGVIIERCPRDYGVNTVFVSLGSNIAPEENLASAIRLLRNKTTVLDLSPVYRTAPQGYKRQADFLNMAAKIHTQRTPLSFKREVIDFIESELVRVRDPRNKNAPRTIDVDIALWNDVVLQYGDKPWEIPDPDITRFAHIAVPLADLAPAYRHPTVGETLAEISETLDQSQIIETSIDVGSHNR